MNDPTPRPTSQSELYARNASRLAELFYPSLNALGQFEPNAVDELPHDYRVLLAHHDHMTGALEAWHTSLGDSTALDEWRAHTWFGPGEVGGGQRRGGRRKERTSLHASVSVSGQVTGERGELPHHLGTWRRWPDSVVAGGGHRLRQPLSQRCQPIAGVRAASPLRRKPGLFRLHRPGLPPTPGRGAGPNAQ